MYIKTFVNYFRSLRLFSLSLTSFHRNPSEYLTEFNQMDIQLFPALSDNYMYLLIDKSTREAAAIDPVEAENIIQASKDKNCKITKVLTTHHHWDHSGGNQKLDSLISGLQHYGGDSRIKPLTTKVSHDDIIDLGNLKIRCLFTPCHTTGHICYYVESTDQNQPSAVFTGDTLFQGGCGRFFEGNAQQMYSALIEKLGKLPENTQVFCGHEYTKKNLEFALTIEPKNSDVKERLDWCKQNKVTVPSTIKQEKSFNPFMRCVLPEVQKAVGCTDAVKAMEKLRSAKDGF